MCVCVYVCGIARLSSDLLSRSGKGNFDGSHKQSEIIMRGRSDCVPTSMPIHTEREREHALGQVGDKDIEKQANTDMVGNAADSEQVV